MDATQRIEDPAPSTAAVSTEPDHAVTPDGTEGARSGATTITVTICENPVFVIGSPRSGTSVLPWALAHHGDFWTSHETEFIHALYGGGQAGVQAAQVYASLRKKESTFLSHHDVDRQEFLSALGLGLNALISRRSEGRRWIDQTPGYTTMAYMLADMFPGGYFIHMLRDGRAVVNSMIHFGDLLQREAGMDTMPEWVPEWAADFETATRTWKTYVEAALAFCADNPERSMTVKNEDLVANTDEEFGRILDFLGASPNPNPANFFRTSRINSSFGREVWGSGKASEKKSEPARPGTAGKAWREWSPEQRATFTELVGDLPERLGYPLDGGE